jgi:hypothetical protein
METVSYTMGMVNYNVYVCEVCMVRFRYYDSVISQA